jgi:N-acetylglutamate synthase-like GNAT family acetyltransferase
MAHRPGDFAVDKRSVVPTLVRVTESAFTIRRATVEDHAGLATLWAAMKYPAQELEKRLTEFQVAVGPDNTVAGAIGMQILGKQALIHSEAFGDFAQADPLRDLLWQRLQAVATNHGLVRLWTAEGAPFWSRCGLHPTTPEELQKLPAAWTRPEARWLTLKLREDVEEALNLDKEFALFMESERERSRQVMGQAKTLKLVATLLAAGLFITVVILGFYLLRNNPGLLNR